ncbi:hypothetical protein M2372_002987 [Chryseobacterium sp. BIGb0232]|nr:hypothetical protein [Chryseobacterium sp. BIGb0232]
MGRTLTKYSFTKDGYFDNKGISIPVGKIDFNDD